jgi:hypothetical protein
MSFVPNEDCIARVIETLYIRAWNLFAELNYDEVSNSISIHIHLQMNPNTYIAPRPTSSARIFFVKIAYMASVEPISM